MLYHKYKPLAARVYCAGLALLLLFMRVVTFSDITKLFS